MNYSLKLKKYTGRDINLLTEVILKNDGSGYSIEEWNIPEAPLTIEELEAIDTSVEESIVEVLINRQKAYPSIGDQLDMIFHAGLGGDEFQAAIQAVKDAHPKGGN